MTKDYKPEKFLAKPDGTLVAYDPNQKVIRKVTALSSFLPDAVVEGYLKRNGNLDGIVKPAGPIIFKEQRKTSC